MSEALFAVMWLIYAFWLGHEVGLRRERKNALKRFAGAIEFEQSCIEIAKKHKRTRLYVGDETKVTSFSVWKVRDVGEFSVTIEEAKQEQPA